MKKIILLDEEEENFLNPLFIIILNIEIDKLKERKKELERLKKLDAKP